MNLHELQVALPKDMQSIATPELVQKINQASTDPIVAENIRDNFISYTKVLSEGKFKIDDYLNAVKYISYRCMGYNKQESYFKAFPDRHKQLVMNNTSPKDISSYVAAYDKNKLVVMMYEQSAIPVWVVNQENVQKAINTLVDVMANSKSDIARVNAANSIITNLTPPKESGPMINIDMRNNTGLDDLRSTLLELATAQQGMIQNRGMTTKQVAEQTLIQGEAHGVN